MKKKIILSCICFTILTFLVLSNANSINAMTIEETSEEHIVGNLVLDNNIYDLGSEIGLTIYTNAYNQEITNVSYIENGFTINEYFVKSNEIIYFSVEHYSSEIMPKIEIVIEFSEESIYLSLFGTVKDEMLFIDPFSYQGANRVYINYLKQNDILKYEEIRSETKPITSNITNDVEINTNQSIVYSNNTPDTFISGQLTWIDDKLIAHPLQFLKVQLWDKEPNGEQLLLETLTDETGNYDFAFKNATGFFQFENGGYDIFIRVIPAGDDVVVYDGNGLEYFMDLDQIDSDYYFEDITSGYYTGVSASFDMNGDYSDFARSLQVSQAAIFASMYYEEMKGSDVEDVTIKYPHNEDSSSSFYRSSYKTIYIVGNNNPNNGRPRSYAAWDVIMHEYGHHISNMEEITNGPGSGHALNISMSSHYYEHFINPSFTCTIDCKIQSYLDDNKPIPFTMDECKYNGMALAWGEGIATYFMLVTQEYYAAYLSNIDFVNDKSYTSYKVSTINIENYQGKFHDSESSIQSILYDIYDNDNTETFDQISLGHQAMFDYIIDSDSNLFTDFYEYLLINYPGDRTVFSSLGKLLEHHNFSTSKPISSNQLTHMCPTFTWGWVEPTYSNYINHYTNRSYSLKFYNQYKECVYQTPTTSNLSYTLSENEWSQILQMSTDFYVSVVIYENNSPVTYYESEWSYFTRPTVFTLRDNESITKTLVGNDCYWFVYAANNTGIHTIKTTGNVDTYGSTFSTVVAGKSNENILLSDDNGGDDNNFKINVHLTSGQTIYIRVNTPEWNGTGDFTITINSSSHNHSYSYVSCGDGAHHFKQCSCGYSIRESCIGLSNGFVFICGKCKQEINGDDGPILMGFDNSNEAYINNEIELIYIKKEKEN